MKILFIGCVQSSERFLQAVISKTDAQIVGIVTKVQSSFNSDHVSLNQIAEDHEIDWLDFQSNDQLLDWVKAKQPDIIYCYGWSYLLPNEIYSLPELGAIGYHPTLLPQNRGRHPIIWALVLGLKETGSTFFYLTETPDAGDILSQEKLEVSNSDTAATLYEKLLTIGESQVVQLTNNLMHNSVLAIEQDENLATYWRKRSKSDGVIDWRMSAITIDRLIRALTKPYVGAFFEFEGKEIIVWKAKVIEETLQDNIEPGKVVAFAGSSFIVKTADYLLLVLEYDGDINIKVGDYL